MVVEIDENKIAEMQEDIKNYVELIKRYDTLVKNKNKIIKAYDKELLTAKEVIALLLELLKHTQQDEEVQEEILQLIEKIKK